MRRKIQGWKAGTLLFGAALVGVAALGASEPPAEPTAKKKVPTLQTPPVAAANWDEAVATKPGPQRNGSQPQIDARRDSFGARDDVRLRPIVQVSYESETESPPGVSGEVPRGDGPLMWKPAPVAQLARRASTGQQPTTPLIGRAGQQPGRGQPSETGQLPANIGQVEVQAIDPLGVVILRGPAQDVEAMKKIIEEIQRISETVEPYNRVFQLQRASASTVRDTILALFSGGTGATSGGAARAGTTQTTGQGTGAQSTAVVQTSALKRFTMAADDRTNTLLVTASPQMMEELAKLIARLDVDGAPIVNEIRVFQLKNAEATEATNILTQAIAGESAATSGATLGGVGAAAQAGTVSGGGEAKIGNRGSVLKFRAIQSGILDTVRITAQVRTNSIFVSAPSSSMPFIAAVIAELDRPPSIVADMKVFPLKNSDATNMRETLSELFDIEVVATTAGGGGGFGAAGTQTQFQRPVAVAEGQAPPISIRVAIDARTNSLLISGPPNALEQVEAVIRLIDGNNLQSRKNDVVRLKNASATAVATAITTFFNQKRTIENQARTAQQTDVIGIYQRLEQEVVVVAESVTNSLLISSSPRYFDDVMKMIEELDREQQQVMIQVMIARLDLRDDYEFGLEWGLQRQVLFERGDLAANPLNPGFNFNSTSALPNTNVVAPSSLGNQALSNFTLGRSGIDGVGGLVLSASSNTVSALLRALEIKGFVKVITRPQIMTLDGRAARLQVGERVPYSSGGQVAATTATTSTGTTNFLDVGIILDVTPTITPDGRVVLQIAPEVSEVKEFTTIATIISAGSTVPITAPRVTITLADTVVSVNDGQTIVLGGMIQPREEETVRKVPWLGDVPYLGSLFRYTKNRKSRTELLIVMTPHIIKGAEDVQRIKNAEVSRVDWVLCDAPSIHGDLGLDGELPPGGVIVQPPVHEQMRLMPADEPILPTMLELHVPANLPRVQTQAASDRSADDVEAQTSPPADWMIPRTRDQIKVEKSRDEKPRRRWFGLFGRDERG